MENDLTVNNHVSVVFFSTSSVRHHDMQRSRWHIEQIAFPVTQYTERRCRNISTHSSHAGGTFQLSWLRSFMGFFRHSGKS